MPTLVWQETEVHQEQPVLTHPFQQRTPLAQWLHNNGFKVIYEPSVRAYQERHRRDYITSAVKARAKRTHPGTFWSWSCPLMQTVFTLILVGVFLLAQQFLVATAIVIIALAMFAKRSELYQGEKELFRTVVRDYRRQLLHYAKWRSVPFFQFKRDCADLVPPQQVPPEIETLVKKAEDELPSLTVMVEYFDQDPFLRFEYHLTDECYYTAVWDEKGFTIGGQ